MISSFTIGNFKAFGPAQHIPLRPITLIFGPNSAGKSSVIHSLLFAHEANRSEQLDIFKTQLGGESVDLGGFRQFTHQSRSENRIALTFRIPTLKSRNSQTWNLQDVTVTATYGIRGVEEKLGLDTAGSVIEGLKEGAESFEDVQGYRRMMDQLIAKVAEVSDDPPALLSYEIAVGDQPLVRASRKGASVTVDSIFLDHPALAVYVNNLLLGLTLATELTEDSQLLAREVISDLATELEMEMGGLLPRSLKKGQGLGVPESPILPMKGATTDTRDQLRLIFSFNFAKLIESVSEEVAGFIARFRYLGPLRSNPPRHLAFAEDTENSNAEGSFAWKAVRDNAELRAKVNEWFGKDFLQTHYELGVDNLISSALAADALETALEGVVSEKYQEWDDARGRQGDSQADELFFNPYEAWDTKIVLKRLLRDIFTRTAAGRVGELTVRDKRNQAYVSHRDIGIGVSQVLPVLAYAFTAIDQVIAIEQPEIHLHPKLQAELGDVFINSAVRASRNTFLIETHSEHLLLRIMRRMRETAEGTLPPDMSPLTPNDVSLLYVSPEKQGSVIQDIGLNERGELVKGWPGGFFEEGLEEVFS